MCQADTMPSVYRRGSGRPTPQCIRAAHKTAAHNGTSSDLHMRARHGQRAWLKAHAPVTARRTSSFALAARAAVPGGPIGVPRGANVGLGLRHRAKRTLHLMASPSAWQQQARPEPLPRTTETERSSSAVARARRRARASARLLGQARLPLRPPQALSLAPLDEKTADRPAAASCAAGRGRRIG